VTTGLAADAFYTSSYVGILPEDIFQEWYAPQRLAAAVGGIPVEQPTLLPEDEMMQRFLSTFDRNSTVDGHKVGVIYIGENQTDEKAILSNVMGSHDYTAFIGGVGKLTKLKGATFNTQGLDKEFDSDGEFTYCWRDRCTELVLHVTTMMPTNLEDDPHCTKKKSHIGNDFVNIIWNNSGLPFKFDTFPSAFNYLYIVITPQARASFVETRHNPNQAAPDQYYRVQVLSREGFPEVSPAAETKMVSGQVLPDFVRLIALNCSVFSLVWANRDAGGEHVSPWRNRFRSIKQLRDKYCPQPEARLASSPTAASNAYAAAHGSLGRPTPRDSGAAFKRASAATYMSDASTLSSSTEVEKSPNAFVP